MSHRSSMFIVFLLVSFCIESVDAQMIKNIKQFLEQCPINDTSYAQIRKDFDIRRNNVPVGDIPCSEPTSLIPLAQYTDELIHLQALRVMYYMDRGKTGHLPWTTGNLYDWVKSKIRGINICDGSDTCRDQFDGKNYIIYGSQNDSQRDLKRTWTGISNNITVYAHEARHSDGFPHSSCCGISGGCDSTFDQANLSSYGIQWWLEKLWLTGEINVGIACLPENEFTETINWHLNNCNLQYRERFCNPKPPVFSVPQSPGGPCPTATLVEEHGTTHAYQSIQLMQNYPNPFNPATTIQFSLPVSGFATLKILNLLGEEIATLVSQELDRGTYTTHWKASGAPSSVYFYRLQVGSFTETKKLLFLR